MRKNYTQIFTYYRCRNKLVSRGYHKNVLISTSNDIYRNLALEDWIYNNVNFDNHRVLFIYRNKPCVVIGRHQNPWVECNIAACIENEVSIARRNSGGGTVYHDLGNLNFTFFAPKTAYDRRENLMLLYHAVRSCFPEVNLQINDRDDMLINHSYKVSGSAAKLSSDSSYHHCTMLVASDLKKISTFLRGHTKYILSNATSSVSSPVANLSAEFGCFNLLDLALEVSDAYNQTKPKTVDPDDEAAYPGINEITASFQSFDWTYGKTPKFSIKVPLERPLSVQITVKKGCIHEVEFFIDDVIKISDEMLTATVKLLQRRPFWMEGLKSLKDPASPILCQVIDRLCCVFGSLS